MAPAVVWVAIGLIPALSNSGRKIFLYAAGGEALVVKWSAAALLLQVGRHADPQKVRLKADTTYADIASVRGVRL